MDDPAKKATGTPPAAAAQPAVDADEFAGIKRPRTRHPLLALGAGVLALFLVVKMRGDITYFLSPGSASDLGDARALLGSERGRRVLDEGPNRLVKVHGTPDRESALQVDTKGSWTFTQFFKILGTDSRLFVHRRQDPLPAARAERDIFEGRLVRFSDLSFEDAIRAYFASHVSATHFFKEPELARAVAPGVDKPVTVRDLTGDTVTLGPNDIVAIVLGRPGEIEISLPVARFATPELASAALVKSGARILRTDPATPEWHVFVVGTTPADRDRVLDAIGNLDWRVKMEDVRETVKARMSDLTMVADRLATRGPAGAPSAAPAEPTGAAVPSAPAAPPGVRVFSHIESIRTLAPVQIPEDAYLIIEGERPRDQMAGVAVALVLLVFATVNLIGLAKGLRR